MARLSIATPGQIPKGPQNTSLEPDKITSPDMSGEVFFHRETLSI